MIHSTTIDPMAEHVFESALVEEFYNKCHGPNGRFCSGGAKGKGAAAATKGHGSGKTDPKALKMTEKYGTRGAGAGAATTKKSGSGSASKKSGGTSGSKYKKDDAGSGKTDPDALRMTNRFGTRGARPAAKRKSASEQSGGTSGSKYKKDDAGSGKTDSSALEWTKKYATRRG